MITTGVSRKTYDFLSRFLFFLHQVEISIELGFGYTHTPSPYPIPIFTRWGSCRTNQLPPARVSSPCVECSRVSYPFALSVLLSRLISPNLADFSIADRALLCLTLPVPALCARGAKRAKKDSFQVNSPSFSAPPSASQSHYSLISSPISFPICFPFPFL